MFDGFLSISTLMTVITIILIFGPPIFWLYLVFTEEDKP